MDSLKTITVHRAGDLNGQTIAPCTIVIGASIEEVLGRKASMTEAQLVYDCEAKAISDALTEHLPQAMLDRVLLQLMQRKCEFSLYKGVGGS